MDIIEALFISGLGVGGLFGAILFITYSFFIKWWYPIACPTLIQRGNGYVWDLDERGKYNKTKDGKEFIWLRKAKKKIKPPKFEYVTVTKGGKAVYPLFSTTNGQFFPLGMKNNVRLEAVEDKSAINWAIQQLAENDLRYSQQESMLSLIVKYVAPISFAVMVIFFTIYFGDKLETAASALSSASVSLAQALEKFSNSPLAQSPGPIPVATGG